MIFAICGLALFVIGLLCLEVGIRNQQHRVELEVSAETYDELAHQLKLVRWGSRVSPDGIDMNNLVLIRCPYVDRENTAP